MLHTRCRYFGAALHCLVHTGGEEQTGCVRTADSACTAARHLGSAASGGLPEGGAHPKRAKRRSAGSKTVPKAQAHRCRSNVCMNVTGVDSPTLNPREGRHSTSARQRRPRKPPDHTEQDDVIEMLGWASDDAADGIDLVVEHSDTPEEYYSPHRS